MQFLPHVAELVLCKVGKQGAFILLPYRQAGAVQDLDTVLPEPQYLVHVDDNAPVAAHKVFPRGKLFFDLRKAAHGAVLTIFGGDQDVVVPGNGIQHLAQRQLNALAGNADLQLRLLTTQRPPQLGGKVLACSDTHGWVEDPDGIDYTVLEHVYNKKRSGHDKGVTLAMYVDEKPNAVWHEGDGRGVWQLPCDIALPCARENTLLLEDAQALVANGCKVVGEGANMPTTIEATTYFQENGVAFMPGKAANAGGVLVSGLEMSQNAEHLSWTFEEVDGKLEQLMRGMFHNVDDTAKEYGQEGNFVMGANIAGFLKVADAMLAQGVC